MTTENLLLIFAGITGLAFVLQCVAVWSAARSIRTLSGEMRRRSQEFSRHVAALQQRMESAADDLQPLISAADTVGRNLDEIAEIVRRRSEDVDQLVVQLTELGRDQATKMDYIVSDTVHKFEQTTEAIQKDILRPAIEISSFVKGVKAGLEALFSKKASLQSGDGRDDELFI